MRIGWSILAAAPPTAARHHARLGVPVLGLIVLAAVVYGIVRLSRRRGAGTRPARHEAGPGEGRPQTGAEPAPRASTGATAPGPARERPGTGAPAPPRPWPPLEPPPAPGHEGDDGRGSPLPTWPLVATRLLELRKRRGLMTAVLVLTVGLPVIVLGIRLLFHLISPHSYGPAGSPSVFSGLMAPMAEFGFIIAATLGATAGTTDLADGVFRHLVVTGRSRLALYLARLPAGLAVVLPLVAAGFAFLCLMTAFASAPPPAALNENGVAVPLHLDKAQLGRWLLAHPEQAAGAFSVGPNGVRLKPRGGVEPTPVSPADVGSFVRHHLDAAYSRYYDDELATLIPATNEMVKIGLWLELEVAVGCVVGLGLGSLIGQRIVATILMIALEIILTPILANVQIPHFVNGQRVIVGVAMDQLRPAGLAVAGGRRVFGGRGALGIPPMPTWAMIAVIAGWIVGWSAIGAWRMATRDA